MLTDLQTLSSADDSQYMELGKYTRNLMEL